MKQKYNFADLDAVIKNPAGVSDADTQTDSFVSVQPFSDFIREGQELPEPVELIPNIIVKGETTLYAGDTGLGKSIHAVQMANIMAEIGETVLYCNFELSKIQMAKRYPQKQFSNRLHIMTIDYGKMHEVTDQGMILGEIEAMALKIGATAVIIDNLTNLCVNSKEGAEAGKIMLQLLSLRMTHGWTMLVLAHVPKRKLSDPMTLNDVAGSKLLSNFADNSVALNRSKRGTDKRYIIQLKYRSFPITLNEKNVQELMLTSADGYLHFETLGFSEEREHLPRSRDEKAELERDIIKELKEPNGMSYRQIADKLGTSHSMVQRVAKENNLCPKSKNGGQK